ncbi:MAG: hypothetical protein ACRC0H_02960, partial [Aeromonas sobria]
MRTFFVAHKANVLIFPLFIDLPRRSRVCKRGGLCENVRAVTVSGRVWLLNHQKQGNLPRMDGIARSPAAYFTSSIGIQHESTTPSCQSGRR